MFLVLDIKKTNQDDKSRQKPIDQDDERNASFISRFRSFKGYHEEAISSALCTYRLCLKKIDRLKKTAQLDKSSSMRRATAEYDVSYEILRGRTRGA